MVLFRDTEAEGVAIGRMAEDDISRVFLDRGFKLVDAETVRHSLGHDKIMGLLAVMSELPRLSRPDSNADKLELR